MDNKFYITTPIYYVNDKPHIGHAYTTIAADVLARLHRQIGHNTFFLTGTDEHGSKIETAAKNANKTPQQFVDEISAKFSMAWDMMNVVPDRFIRTTDENHVKAVQKALERMKETGDVYLGSYEGMYCKGCEQFKTERDLVDGKCPDHKTVPEKMSEETYMFKLSKYQKILQEKIESDEFQILPFQRKNEILSFYKNEGLQDVSFSRKNVSWGIPIPWDPSHTVYVWADAFLNYLTGIDWDGGEKIKSDYWPADVQLMSKDILRVHATIWPAMLLSLGIPLPRVLFIHGFFTIAGQKMSKTLGNVIDPVEWAQKYGPDVVRYYLLREVPFGQDGDVSEEKLKSRYNSDLANGLGNFFSRVTNMVEKFFEGNLEAELNKSPKDLSQVSEAFYSLNFSQGLTTAWEAIAWADGLIDKSKPWELFKTEPQKVKELLISLCALLYEVSFRLSPVMPETCNIIRKTLESERITKPEQPLFPKFE
jgi:methionyl-tRNA synthetase